MITQLDTRKYSQNDNSQKLLCTKLCENNMTKLDVDTNRQS